MCPPSYSPEALSWRVVQNLQHEILNSLCSNGQSTKLLSRHLASQLCRVATLFPQLLEDLTENLSRVYGSRVPSERSLEYIMHRVPASQVVAALQSSLVSHIPDAPAVVRTSVVPVKSRIDGVLESRRQRALSRLEEYCRRELIPRRVRMWVHGSVADGTVLPYSDLDTFVILPSDRLCDAASVEDMVRAIYKSVRFLYEFDPLQHHAHICVTDLDLCAYCESYLPPAALHGACTLGETHVQAQTFEVREGTYEGLNTLWRLVRMIRTRCLRTQPWRGLYDLKLFTSVLMLIPAALLTVIGQSCHKRDSFELARPLFSDCDWHAIEWASGVRQSWQEPRLLSLVYRLGRFIFRDSKHRHSVVVRLSTLMPCSCEAKPDIYNNALGFAENAWLYAIQAVRGATLKWRI